MAAEWRSVVDVCGRHMRHDQILSSKMKQPVLESSRTLVLIQ